MKNGWENILKRQHVKLAEKNYFYADIDVVTLPSEKFEGKYVTQ
jgi:hypothetical protein